MRRIGDSYFRRRQKGEKDESPWFLRLTGHFPEVGHLIGERVQIPPHLHFVRNNDLTGGALPGAPDVWHQKVVDRPLPPAHTGECADSYG